MDEIEHSPLQHIPMRSLSLTLARSTIRMRHGPRWSIDKVNPVHDLVICLSGAGKYVLGDYGTEVTLSPGHAMLIPAWTRFRGRHGGGEETFTGIAQHFSLDLFGRGDLIGQLDLAASVRLSRWDSLRHTATDYHATVPHGSTTLIQHHQFMVLLLAVLEDAFLGWKVEDAAPDSQDHLSIQIMRVATRLSSDPLGAALEEAMQSLGYNEDYFRRAFRDRMGLTPQKFRERKRMEFAANRLGQGLSVKAVAAELGYTDPYFFSRMFKRHLGASPSVYRETGRRP